MLRRISAFSKRSALREAPSKTNVFVKPNVEELVLILRRGNVCRNTNVFVKPNVEELVLILRRGNVCRNTNLYNTCSKPRKTHTTPNSLSIFCSNSANIIQKAHS